MQAKTHRQTPTNPCPFLGRHCKSTSLTRARIPICKNTRRRCPCTAPNSLRTRLAFWPSRGRMFPLCNSRSRAFCFLCVCAYKWGDDPPSPCLAFFHTSTSHPHSPSSFPTSTIHSPYLILAHKTGTRLPVPGVGEGGSDPAGQPRGAAVGSAFFSIARSCFIRP